MSNISEKSENPSCSIALVKPTPRLAETEKDERNCDKSFYKCQACTIWTSACSNCRNSDRRTKKLRSFQREETSFTDTVDDDTYGLKTHLTKVLNNNQTLCNKCLYFIKLCNNCRTSLRKQETIEEDSNESLTHILNRSESLPSTAQSPRESLRTLPSRHRSPRDFPRALSTRPLSPRDVPKALSYMPQFPREFPRDLSFRPRSPRHRSPRKFPQNIFSRLQPPREFSRNLFSRFRSPSRMPINSPSSFKFSKNLSSRPESFANQRHSLNRSRSPMYSKQDQKFLKAQYNCRRYSPSYHTFSMSSICRTRSGCFKTDHTRKSNHLITKRYPNGNAREASTFRKRSGTISPFKRKRAYIKVDSKKTVSNETTFSKIVNYMSSDMCQTTAGTSMVRKQPEQLKETEQTKNSSVSVATDLDQNVKNFVSEQDFLKLHENICHENSKCLKDISQQSLEKESFYNTLLLKHSKTKVNRKTSQTSYCDTNKLESSDPEANTIESKIHNNINEDKQISNGLTSVSACINEDAQFMNGFDSYKNDFPSCQNREIKETSSLLDMFLYNKPDSVSVQGNFNILKPRNNTENERNGNFQEHTLSTNKEKINKQWEKTICDKRQIIKGGCFSSVIEANAGKFIQKTHSYRKPLQLDLESCACLVYAQNAKRMHVDDPRKVYNFKKDVSLDNERINKSLTLHRENKLRNACKISKYSRKGDTTKEIFQIKQFQPGKFVQWKHKHYFYTRSKFSTRRRKRIKQKRTSLKTAFRKKKELLGLIDNECLTLTVVSPIHSPLIARSNSSAVITGQFEPTQSNSEKTESNEDVSFQPIEYISMLSPGENQEIKNTLLESSLSVHSSSHEDSLFTDSINCSSSSSSSYCSQNRNKFDNVDQLTARTEKATSENNISTPANVLTHSFIKCSEKSIQPFSPNSPRVDTSERKLNFQDQGICITNLPHESKKLYCLDINTKIDVNNNYGEDSNTEVRPKTTDEAETVEELIGEYTFEENDGNATVSDHFLCDDISNPIILSAADRVYNVSQTSTEQQPGIHFPLLTFADTIEETQSPECTLPQSLHEFSDIISQAVRLSGMSPEYLNSFNLEDDCNFDMNYTDDAVIQLNTEINGVENINETVQDFTSSIVMSTEATNVNNGLSKVFVVGEEETLETMNFTEEWVNSLPEELDGKEDLPTSESQSFDFVQENRCNHFFNATMESTSKNASQSGLRFIKKKQIETNISCKKLQIPNYSVTVQNSPTARDKLLKPIPVSVKEAYTIQCRKLNCTKFKKGGKGKSVKKDPKDTAPRKYNLRKKLITNNIINSSVTTESLPQDYIEKCNEKNKTNSFSLRDDTLNKDESSSDIFIQQLKKVCPRILAYKRKTTPVKSDQGTGKNMLVKRKRGLNRNINRFVTDMKKSYGMSNTVQENSNNNADCKDTKSKKPKMLTPIKETQVLTEAERELKKRFKRLHADLLKEQRIQMEKLKLEANKPISLKSKNSLPKTSQFHGSQSLSCLTREKDKSEAENTRPFSRSRSPLSAEEKHARGREGVLKFISRLQTNYGDKIAKSHNVTRKALDDCCRRYLEYRKQLDDNNGKKERRAIRKPPTVVQDDAYERYSPAHAMMSIQQSIDMEFKLNNSNIDGNSLKENSFKMDTTTNSETKSTTFESIELNNHRVDIKTTTVLETNKILSSKQVFQVAPPPTSKGRNANVSRRQRLAISQDSLRQKRQAWVSSHFRGNDENLSLTNNNMQGEGDLMKKVNASTGEIALENKAIANNNFNICPSVNDSGIKNVNTDKEQNETLFCSLEDMKELVKSDTNSLSLFLPESYKNTYNEMTSKAEGTLTSLVYSPRSVDNDNYVKDMERDSDQSNQTNSCENKNEWKMNSLEHADEDRKEYKTPNSCFDCNHISKEKSIVCDAPNIPFSSLSRSFTDQGSSDYLEETGNGSLSTDSIMSIPEDIQTNMEIELSKIGHLAGFRSHYAKLQCKSSKLLQIEDQLEDEVNDEEISSMADLKLLVHKTAFPEWMEDEEEECETEVSSFVQLQTDMNDADDTALRVEKELEYWDSEVSPWDSDLVLNLGLYSKGMRINTTNDNADDEKEEGETISNFTDLNEESQGVSVHSTDSGVSYDTNQVQSRSIESLLAQFQTDSLDSGVAESETSEISNDYSEERKLLQSLIDSNSSVKCDNEADIKSLGLQPVFRSNSMKRLLSMELGEDTPEDRFNLCLGRNMQEKFKVNTDSDETMKQDFEIDAKDDMEIPPVFVFESLDEFQEAAGKEFDVSYAGFPFIISSKSRNDTNNKSPSKLKSESQNLLTIDSTSNSVYQQARANLEPEYLQYEHNPSIPRNLRDEDLHNIVSASSNDNLSMQNQNLDVPSKYFHSRYSNEPDYSRLNGTEQNSRQSKDPYDDFNVEINDKLESLESTNSLLAESKVTLESNKQLKIRRARRAASKMFDPRCCLSPIPETQDDYNQGQGDFESKSPVVYRPYSSSMQKSGGLVTSSRSHTQIQEENQRSS